MNGLLTTDFYRTGAYPINARPIGIGRNAYFGPSTATVDIRLMKTFMTHHDRAKLQFGIEAFNLLNRANVVISSPYLTESFKGPVDGLRQFSIAIAQTRSKRKRRHLMDKFLQSIAEDEVPDRPGRREPRAVKRRPKPYPILNKPRHKFKDVPHANRYWKSKPRKTTAK